jgi:hypothetical protein
MNLLTRIFTSLLISAFGLFLASPIFALSNNTENLIVLSSNISDTCTSNIQCEVLADGQYFCHSGTENISSQWWSIHHIPTSKSGDTIISNNSQFSIPPRENLVQKIATYIGPDTYIYPFVGIIKIQV